MSLVRQMLLGQSAAEPDREVRMSHKFAAFGVWLGIVNN